MSSFKPSQAHKWETHSSVSHDSNSDLRLYVSADGGDQIVRLSAQGMNHGCSMKLTAERARELAAELLAAADSLQTVPEAP